ncbi:MAG: hypothetical protein M1816_000509 [Peltula sp. TS41687]|nr:MAG: hypothetical protein M1816_000509 [Peltula sp. TS41687]
MAYVVDISEAMLFDYKYGFCKNGDCDSWSTWSEAFSANGYKNNPVDFAVYVSAVLVLASSSGMLVMLTRNTIPPANGAGSDAYIKQDDLQAHSSQSYFTAAGSGVAEIQLILNGSGLRGYLSAKTFVVKTLALILSAASGMSLGKEGPYIHLATCISDIVAGLFGFNRSDQHHETLRAGAASGLSVAFGAPVSGVMFALEDLGFWNKYTRLSATELLSELNTPCDNSGFGLTDFGACTSTASIPSLLKSLASALLIKSLLTIATFGLKVPAGIYIPSMVVGGLLGKFIRHAVQLAINTYPAANVFSECRAGSGNRCTTPAVYAMIGAGATMCGVTRLPVTLAMILFELTGSLDYLIPFSVAIFISKWIADAVEPSNIYDLVSEINLYPPGENEIRRILAGTLDDLIPAEFDEERVIDITNSPIIPVCDLQRKLYLLKEAGEQDSGFPITSQGVLIGFIPALTLDSALKRLQGHDLTTCFVSTTECTHSHQVSASLHADLTFYVDPLPVALEAQTHLRLVYDYFRKLGLCHLCIVRNGRYAGMVSRKAFEEYVGSLYRAQKGGVLYKYYLDR